MIGLLLNSLFDGYEAAVWRGAIRAAAELDVDLLCFLGGALGDGSGRASLFELAGPESVDAVVVVAPSVGILSGPAEVGALIARLAPLPAVSLSEPLPGIASVVSDNATGIARLMDHLVLQHGRRRVAFVGGPVRASEAAARFDAYRLSLERLGIAFDPALVLEGDWSAAAGVRAIRALEERGAPYDAVLASNDHTALAALDELRRRGVDVPGQVAVCGFDDVSDAGSAAPPLTTVRQPLGEMAREAVRRALALVRGEDVAPIVRFPAELVLRRSCGCSVLVPEKEDAEPGSVAVVPPPASGATLAARLEAATPGLGARIGAPRWAEQLAEALSAPGPARDRRFLEALETVFTQGEEAMPDPADWFPLLRRALSLVPAGGPEEAERLAALSRAAHELIGSRAAAAERRRRARSEEETRVLHRLVPFPLPEDAFIGNLLPTLDLLGIRSFFLSRYRDVELREAELVVAHDRDGLAALDEPRDGFPARWLLPGRFLGTRRRALAVLPVQSPDGPIGFALCEIGPTNGSCYEVLMHQIGSVLSMNGLVAKVREQQRQYLEAARQAGMAEIAVGTLHNVGNLLNSVGVSAEQIAVSTGTPHAENLRRAVRLLSDHRSDLPGFFATDARAPLVAEYLERLSEQLTVEQARIGREAEGLMERVEVIRNTIRGLQDLAREGYGPVLRERVDLRAVIAAVMQAQAPLLSRHGVALRQRHDGAAPLAVTDRAKLFQVLVNLTKNAVEAMRECGAERVLRVETAVAGDRVRVTLGDTGVGISPDHLGRLFSFGFTTKPDGHGFGLHSCAIHAHQLGGSLTASSPGPGLGATFTLELPCETGEFV